MLTSRACSRLRRSAARARHIRATEAMIWCTCLALCAGASSATNPRRWAHDPTSSAATCRSLPSTAGALPPVTTRTPDAATSALDMALGTAFGGDTPTSTTLNAASPIIALGTALPAAARSSSASLRCTALGTAPSRTPSGPPSGTASLGPPSGPPGAPPSGPSSEEPKSARRPPAVCHATAQHGVV